MFTTRYINQLGRFFLFITLWEHSEQDFGLHSEGDDF